jgi:hypothetical protein
MKNILIFRTNADTKPTEREHENNLKKNTLIIRTTTVVFM